MGTINRFLIALTMFLMILTDASGAEFHKFHLDHQDGLCRNYIRNINEDGHGFVWVVTGSGLNRFDGSKFQKFTKEDSGLISNELNCVLADPIDKDIVWIGSRYNGLCKFDYKTGEITPFPGELYTPDIPALVKSSDNKIWIIHYHRPPEKLDPATGTTTRLFKERPEDLPLPIWCIAEDSTRQLLYIGHENHGFTVVDLNTLKFKNFKHISGNNSSLCGNTVYSIYPDSSGKVFIGTENGLSLFDPETELFKSIIHDSTSSSILPGAVKSIVRMSDQSIWIATSQGGISILSGNNAKNQNYIFNNLTTHTFINPESNLYSNSPVNIFEDSYGNKWIGYYSDGIDVISYESPFLWMMPIFPASGINHSHPAIWSVATDIKGDFWIGGEREIAKVSNFTTKRFSLPPSVADSNTPVRSIFPDTQRFIWIGTYNSGAYRFDTVSESFSEITGIDREVRCFLKDNNDRILAGTHNGIYFIDADMNASPADILNKNLPDKYITSLRNDINGNLLVGSFGQGVTVINRSGNIIKHIDTRIGLPSNAVNSIQLDSKGRIWIATREGVVRVSPADYSDIKSFPMPADGTTCNIKALEEGSDGKIWMSSDDGLSCYDPITDKIASYSYIYRTTLNSFLEGCSCIGANGTIVFGSLNGIVFFQPDNAKSHDIKSGEVKITHLLANDINGKDINHVISIPVNSNKIELPYNLNTFRFKFNNPDITQSVNREIKYNMKGVNEVWSLGEVENEAIYRNMKPGKYEFQISQRSFGGEWSSPETLLTITVTPPFYLTWWAKMIYVVAAIVVIYFIVYFYKYKLNLEKNLEIEKENSKNNHLLNEERLVFYTNVTHELRTPLSLIIGPIEDLVNDPELRDEHRKKLHTIRTSSMRLLNLINGILEFRKTETRNRKLEVVYGNFANYVREIGLRFKELNNNKNVVLHIDVDEAEEIEMYYDPEMITTILNNLLGNALKYTKSGTVTLSLHVNIRDGVRYADLSVTDTGEGMAKEELPHIFKRYYQANHNKKIAGTGIGLALTKNLVELHEGSITVDSEKGKGSRFTVSLLIENSYPSASHKENTETTDTDVAEITDTDIAAHDNLTLLIVEDDEDVRDYIANSFSDTFKVICAGNGLEGLKATKEYMPDIVVSDIMMPEMDGIELCHAIKSDISTSHVPVILLTAKDSLLDKEEGYNVGADSYITKPFSAKLLQSRINNILETRHRLSLIYLSTPSSDSSDDAGSDDTGDSKNNDENKLTPLDKEFISRLRTLVENNIELEEMDMAFLTDKMCMSHSTLYRKVKSITGLTPNEFIRKIKLTRSIELLDSGKVSLNEIPYLTGFNSMAYFRRVFKKEFGVSPSEYINGSKSPE